MPIEGDWRGTMGVCSMAVTGGSGLMSPVCVSGEVSMAERRELNEDTSIC